MWVSFAFLSYMVLCNIIYYYTNSYFKNNEGGKQKYSNWAEQYKIACGNSMPNLTDIAILACNYVVFGYGCYVFTIYRLKIL